jgi:hypothetical protein
VTQPTNPPASGVTHTKTSRKEAKALLADLRKQLTEGKNK